ncbi:hypothetical protein C8R44DRAFT_851072 [Mycena epipterygia]|nr:hypothetical protein C8R44DRAFT_851072 [Mycena epipterygia]
MVSSIIRAGLVINFALIVSAAVIPRVPAGTQFVTGPCTADADCAEGCCAFTTGKCAGPVIALTRDGGCGFGTSTPNANAAIALGQFPGAVAAFSASLAAAAPAATQDAAAAAAPPAAVSTAAAAVAPAGTQFITGACTSDADCASGCCNAKTALCAARLVALEGAGCGFGSSSAGVGAASPVGGAVATAAAAATTAAAAVSTAAAAVAPAGTQFITGACISDADCASGCCNAKTALCAARLVALEGAGCGFGSSSAGVGAASPAGGAAATAAAAATTAAAAVSTTAAAVAPAGTQFITGACTSDADCASGCCNAKTALCAARLVALEGAGCGFGSSSAGVGAASPIAAAPAAASPAVAAPVAAAAATTAAPATSTGTQFITGTCASDADCASGCCGKKSGLCAARLVALEGAGCGFGTA